jgi:hypothetical protein
MTFEVIIPDTGDRAEADTEEGTTAGATERPRQGTPTERSSPVATYTVLLALEDEDDRGIEELATELNAVINEGGYLGGNFLVTARVDDDRAFWNEWDRRRPTTASDGCFAAR